MEEEKKTDSPANDKMDQEKMHYHYHRRGPLGMILGMLVFLFIIGGVFSLGRVSGRGYFSAGLGHGKAFAFEDRGTGMMGGNYGRQMMRGRDRDDSDEQRSRIAGQISAVNADNIVIKDTDGTAYTIKISSDTSITINGKIDKASNLKTSGEVVVIGSSNSDASIDATFIRCLQ